eukprot:jgi/Orpsp1_1/1179372/evm.model.c7180000069034.1
MKFYTYLLTILFAFGALSYTIKSEIREDIIDWTLYDKCINNTSTLESTNVDIECDEVIEQVLSLENKCLDSINKECPVNINDKIDNICTVYESENCQKIVNDTNNFHECKILFTKSKKNITDNILYNIIYLFPKYFCVKNENNQYCPSLDDFKVNIEGPDGLEKYMGISETIDKISDICVSRICTDALIGYVSSLKKSLIKVKRQDNSTAHPADVDELISYLQSEECQTSNATNKKYNTVLLIALSLLLIIIF